MTAATAAATIRRPLSQFRQNATTTHLDTTPTEPARHRHAFPLPTPRFQCFAAIALAGQTATSA